MQSEPQTFFESFVEVPTDKKNHLQLPGERLWVCVTNSCSQGQKGEAELSNLMMFFY